MFRWDGDDYSENTKVDAFLEDIKQVCKKHGMSISHEDCQGAFEIENYSELCMEWLAVAYDKTR